MAFSEKIKRAGRQAENAWVGSSRRGRRGHRTGMNALNDPRLIAFINLERNTDSV